MVTSSSSTTKASTSNNNQYDLVPLILFALAAKLRIDQLRKEHKNKNKQWQNISQEALIEPDEERRIRRNLRLSIDSPDYSEHHFHNSDAASPLCSSRECKRSNVMNSSTYHRSDDEEDPESSVTFLHAGCPRWRKLMERVSFADSVLTRDVTMDFKTKNSNWSHFEGYESPTKEGGTSTQQQNNDAVQWPDLPENNNHADTNIHNNNNNNNQSNTITQPEIHRRTSSLEQIRSYNSNIMPKKLIMIRHGQSEGNVDEILYSTKPDNNMRLTKLGWDSAKMMGKALRDEIGKNETVHFVVSPYVRTVETFHGIASAWVDPEDFGRLDGRNSRLKAWYTRLMEMGLSWHEDPRIREQDFGNYQDPETIRKCKSERHKFGSFYYRFPYGESASDVFDRVSTFLDSLWRSFETQKAQNYVLVTHGISIRVFLARYFRYSIDQFNMLANPKNCEMVILKHDGLGKLQLDSRCELEFETVDYKCDNTANTVNETKHHIIKVVGYKKHKRLKLLPPDLIQPRTAHMFYDDPGS